MAEELNIWLIGGGLAIGVLFGMVVQQSRFCMLSAVTNLVLMRDYRQLHAVLAAIAVAVIGTQILESGGWVAVAESSYRTARLDWAGTLLGGLVFGFGTVLAGGCAGRTVVCAAEGNLGSLLVLLVFAFAAMMTLYGVLSPLRVSLVEATATELSRGDASIATLLGLPSWALTMTIGVVCLAVILFVGRGGRSTGLVVAGALVGMLVVAGWWVTGYLAQDEFELTVRRPGSLVFAGPLARAGLYVTSQSIPWSVFSIPMVFGVMLGAAVTAIVTRTFRWTPPQADQVGYYLIGGLMMGIGAILAGGCNIGNGLSGISTLSVKAVIAIAAIIVGTRLALAWLLHKEEYEQAPAPGNAKIHAPQGSPL